MKAKTKQQAAEDPLLLEGIDGLGSSSIKLLNEQRIFTTKQLIHKNPTWLKDITGIDKDKCGQIFSQIKERLVKAKLMDPQEVSATELLAIRERVKKIKTGCNIIDHILKGGIECKSITEVYGENGAGKTQFSHNLAIQVQLPIEQGGLAEPDKQPPMVLYIDTENTFRPERIISMLEGKKLIPEFPSEIKNKVTEGKPLDENQSLVYREIKEKQFKESEKFLDNIIVMKATDAYQQCQKIHDAIQGVTLLPIRLIIIDSGTAQFRGSYLGRGNTKSKFDLMNEMLHDLLAIADLDEVAILFVNQIYNSPDPEIGSDPDIPYGGNVIGHGMPYRLKIEKSGKKHRLSIVKSPHMDNDSVRFDITQAGIVDIQE